MNEDIRKYAERLLQRKLGEVAIKLRKKGLTDEETLELVSELIFGSRLTKKIES